MGETRLMQTEGLPTRARAHLNDAKALITHPAIVSRATDTAPMERRTLSQPTSDRSTIGIWSRPLPEI